MDKPIKKPTAKFEPAVEPSPLVNKKDKPVLDKAGDNWYIAVYFHPVVKIRFSYSLTINNRVRLNPSPIDDQQPNLFGCFTTPQEALEAAMEEVNE